MAFEFKRRLAQLLDEFSSLFARRVHVRRNAPSIASPDMHLFAGNSVDSFFPDAEQPFDTAVSKRWAMGGLRCDDLTFTSHHDPLAPRLRSLHRETYVPNSTAHVRWVRHSDEDDRPTVVFLHSWMQSGRFLEESVVLPTIARTLNVNVARLQLPYHGSRRPHCSTYSGEYYWTADLTRTFEAIRQSVLDSRTLMRFLREEAGGPVGMMGQSLGGIVTLATACVERELDFAVPVAAHLDLAGVLEDASLLRPMADELAAQGWRPGDVQEYLQTLGLADRSLAMDPDRLLLVAGRHDRFLTAPRVERMWQRWDQPAIHWYNGGHLGIYTHMREYLGAVRGFLNEKQLGAAFDSRSASNQPAPSAAPAVLDPSTARARPA